MLIRPATVSVPFLHQSHEKHIGLALYNYLILLQLTYNKIQIRNL